MPGLFISYRREDSEGQAGRLFEGLKARFGQDRVFIDVDSIEPGRDFRRTIEERVSSCDVLLALIGRTWVQAADKEGRRRLDNPKDLVRLEIATGLSRDITVIPVLVQGAAMPNKEELPPDLQGLAWRNALELRHTRWDDDVTQLVTTLERHCGPRRVGPQRRASRWLWAAVPALALSVLAVNEVLRHHNIDVPRLLSDAREAEVAAEVAATPMVRLDGHWKGTITYHWGPVVDETFTLRLVDGKVIGSAGFLGHGHTILEGSLDGSSVRFDTRRMVTAGTSGRWEAVNHYAGAIDGDHIDMVLTIEDPGSPQEPVTFRLSRVADQQAAKKTVHND